MLFSTLPKEFAKGGARKLDALWPAVDVWKHMKMYLQTPSLEKKK